MNKTKIEWTDYSWNPITGCKHGCWYCYAKKLFTRFHKSFEPTFYPERLNELDRIKKPAKIFVCSVADLFAFWTKKEWRNLVLRELYRPRYNHLTFQLLTKSPEGIPHSLRVKENIWVGVTVTSANEINNIKNLVKNYNGLKFISFEPLLGLIPLPEEFKEINWIIIGKLTGSKRIRLENHWVEYLIKMAREFNIPIFLKNNLKWPEKIQEFPENLILKVENQKK